MILFTSIRLFFIRGARARIPAVAWQPGLPDNPRLANGLFVQFRHPVYGLGIEARTGVCHAIPLRVCVCVCETGNQRTNPRFCTRPQSDGARSAWLWCFPAPETPRRIARYGCRRHNFQIAVDLRGYSSGRETPQTTACPHTFPIRRLSPAHRDAAAAGAAIPRRHTLTPPQLLHQS